MTDPRTKFLTLLVLSLFTLGPISALCAVKPDTYLTETADSLQRALYGTENEERVAILNALSWEIKFANPSRAYRLAQEARDLATALEDSVGIATAIKHMGIARAMQGRYREALPIIFEEIEWRKALGDSAAIASANNNLGFILRQQGNYDLALEYFYRSLRLSRELDSDPNLQAITLNNIGQIHRAKGQLDMALEAHMESIEVLERVPDGSFARANNMNNLGEIFQEKEDYTQALAYFHKALAMERKLANPQRESEALNHMAEVHLAMGNSDSALYYVNAGLDLATPLENKFFQCDLEHTAAQVYALVGDYVQAYMHQVRYADLNDSLLNQAKEEAIVNLEDRFRTAQEQNELDIMRKEKALNAEELHRARLTRNGALVLIALLAIAILLVYKNNRIRNRANRILTSQKNEMRKQRDELEVTNQTLKKANHEMDNFMYRVSHDLRSPLTSLMGLIKLAQTEDDPAKRQEYMDLMNRSVGKLDSFIQDMIDLTRNNRQEVTFAPVPLEPLIEEYFESYRYIDGNSDIECLVEVKGRPELVTDKDRLGIVLGNLINNAIRYTKAYRDDAMVKVITQVDAERATIQVRDNGPGIGEEHRSKIFDMFYRCSNTTNGSGLGLYIVAEAVEKLGGTLRVVSEVRQGATFILEIPNQNPGSKPKPLAPEVQQLLKG